MSAEEILMSASAHAGTTMGRELDPFVSSFWYWNKFSFYLLALGILTSVLLVFTLIFQESQTYIMLLGLASSGVEVSLLSNNARLCSEHRSFGLTLIANILWVSP